MLAIYDTNGIKQAEYEYDAWGKVLNVINCECCCCDIGNINPFRYRSYYYDVETGLYYLQTRYYDPEVGRFINSDSLRYLGYGAELSNYNLFAYCGNNPVIGCDPQGTFNWWNFTLGVVAATLATSICIIAAPAVATALGITATASFTTLVATGCVISAGTAMIDEIVEDGCESLDVNNVVIETFTGGIQAAISVICPQLPYDKVVQVGLEFMLDYTSTIVSDCINERITNLANGQNSPVALNSLNETAADYCAELLADTAITTIFSFLKSDNYACHVINELKYTILKCVFGE